VNFTDPQLKKYYESTLDEATDFSFVMRQVGALINTHDFFQMLEGPHSARVHETVQHLLSPEMRPGLRRWYLIDDSDTDPSAAAFRDQLGRMAKEKFGEKIAPPDVSISSANPIRIIQNR
jgi:hypothetical protein